VILLTLWNQLVNIMIKILKYAVFLLRIVKFLFMTIFLIIYLLLNSYIKDTNLTF